MKTIEIIKIIKIIKVMIVSVIYMIAAIINGKIICDYLSVTAVTFMGFLSLLSCSFILVMSLVGMFKLLDNIMIRENE